MFLEAIIHTCKILVRLYTPANIIWISKKFKTRKTVMLVILDGHLALIQIIGTIANCSNGSIKQ